jgi:hypothetical protein
MQFTPMFEIANEIDFVLSESQRLRCDILKLRWRLCFTWLKTIGCL